MRGGASVPSFRPVSFDPEFFVSLTGDWSITPMFGSPSGGGEEMVSSSPSLPLVLGTPDSHLEDSPGLGGVQASEVEGGTEPPSPVDPRRS